VPPENIIEISSDEDEELQPPRKRALTGRESLPPTNELDYQTTLSLKDREIEGLKKREKELERVVGLQKKEMEAKMSQSIPRVGEIEEELTCDICAIRMWTPYRLTECGHVFCADCLLKWFDDIHVRFLTTHPGYTPLPPRFKAVLRRPLEFPHDCYKAYLHMTLSPTPQYTCPSCRTVVTRRPVEDFKVKALVSWLGSVQGTEPPESNIRPGTGGLLFDGYSLL